jgi:hypothetical protein
MPTPEYEHELRAPSYRDLLAGYDIDDGHLVTARSYSKALPIVSAIQILCQRLMLERLYEAAC